MYLRHLTSDLGKSQNTNLTFNRLFFAWINQKLHTQLEMTFLWSIQVDFDLKHKKNVMKD